MTTTRSEILKQKLHEMCQLSEYYLNLLMNNQSQSSYSLTKEYSKKLNEIALKHDRLLEVSELETEQKKRIQDEKEQRTRTITKKTMRSIKKTSSKVQVKSQQKPTYQVKYDSDDEATDNDTDTYDDDECSETGTQVIGKSISNLSKDSGYSEVHSGHLTNSYMSSINDDDVSYTSSFNEPMPTSVSSTKSRFLSDMTINEDELLVNNGFTACNQNFKFDNEALMNMSMIENIEIKNNNQNPHLNFDMNSSILIFN
jgi:hypothetical protein